MTVPLTLLGLLERGPSHGYDLKRDYDAYFGRGKPLRYSQVYATLSRLARDGKAVAGPVEQEAGPERRRYVITADGFELQFGTNHLGHFAFTGLVLEAMLPVPGSRVVTVSSTGHRVRRGQPQAGRGT